MLRLRLGPAGALEIAHEGPELGGRTGLIERFDFEPRAELAPRRLHARAGCHVCRALEPAVDSLRREPALGGRSLRGGRRRRRLGGAGDPGRPLRDRARARRDGAARRGPSTTSPSSRASSRPPSGGAPSGCGSRRWVSEPAPGAGGSRGRSTGIASSSSRRGFLARVGKGMAALTAAGRGLEAGRARRGRRLPLLRPHLHDRLLPASARAVGAADRPRRLPGRALDGQADRQPRPAGQRARASRSTPTATRSAIPTAARCRRRRARSSARRASTASSASAPSVDGGWYRCCGGQVRKLVDCCSTQRPADQRRRRARGLLLPRPQGLLRHVLRHERALLMDPLLIALAVAGLLVGATGTWSPCGFSMIETIGPTGHTGGAADDARRLGHLRPRSRSLGGALTFGLLGLARRGAARRRRARSPTRSPPRSRWPPRSPRRAGCRSSPRSAASSRSAGAAACRCRSPPPATASCSGSASRPSSSPTASGR